MNSIGASRAAYHGFDRVAFTLASLTMATAFATRVRLRGRAILLPLTLPTLTVFYSFPALGPAWALTAFHSQPLAAMLCVHYFSACAASMLAAVGQARHLAHPPVVFSHAELAIPFIRGHHTVLTGGAAIFSLNSAGIFLLIVGPRFATSPGSKMSAPADGAGRPRHPPRSTFRPTANRNRSPLPPWPGISAHSPRHSSRSS